eukprot:COSAG06_NODE_795_length_12228_cov_51.650507_4_plen_76_part_00
MPHWVVAVVAADFTGSAAWQPTFGAATAATTAVSRGGGGEGARPQVAMLQWRHDAGWWWRRARVCTVIHLRKANA